MKFVNIKIRNTSPTVKVPREKVRKSVCVYVGNSYILPHTQLRDHSFLMHLSFLGVAEQGKGLVFIHKCKKITR